MFVMFVMALMIADVFFTSWQDTFSLTATSHFKSLSGTFFAVIFLLGMSYALKEDITR